MNANLIEMPVLVGYRDVMHRSEERGLRIGRVDTIRMPGGALVEVDHWYDWESGRLHHLGDPRPVK